MKTVFQLVYIISRLFDDNKKLALWVKLLVIGFVFGESLVPNREEKAYSIVERLENSLKDFIDVGDVVSLIKKL